MECPRGCYHRTVRLLLVLSAAVGLAGAQTGENVLLIVNRNDPASLAVAGYYRERRAVPAGNVCYLAASSAEEIDWETYQTRIERPVGDCLKKGGLQEKVLYLATTMGVPLKIRGGGQKLAAEGASVDSELTMLYAKLKGATVPRAGGIDNPFFMKRNSRFRHTEFPIYLVTRLAAYDLDDAKAMIDRSLAARNRGKFVIDLRSNSEEEGDNYLRTAALLLPRDRVILDEGPAVVYGQKDVIGYASWGSNDHRRKQRWLGFHWLPGAIATEYVSTNGRTLKPPPDNWTYTNWRDTEHLWMGSPQGLTGDLIHEGATGASGNVDEPYLVGCARPDYLLPAWYQGRNLAESYYMALRWLSWQGVVLGDPLCSLGKP